MSQIEEQLTAQFYNWELRGRGWQVFSQPVSPEPPFRPFLGHYVPEMPSVDDGRRPTLLSGFVRTLSRRLATTPPPLSSEPVPLEEEPAPEHFLRSSLIEIQTSLPPHFCANDEEFEQFLLSLTLCREPITFEIFGTSDHIIAQFAVARDDHGLVLRQLQAFFPDAVFLAREGALQSAWEAVHGADAAVVEFGLAREFMFPLANGAIDPFVGIIGAMESLQSQEFALLQITFQPVRHPWADSVLRSVTDGEGGPFFVNMPELVKEAKGKTFRPLYAVVARVAAQSPEHEMTWELLRNLASAMAVFAKPAGNELIPLRNEDYPFEAHVDDVLLRQCRRPGMLLNSEELLGFVHLPSGAVRSKKLQRQTLKTKAAPISILNSPGLVLGDNPHAGVVRPVALSREQRVRHIHVIGGSGTGKSTLLFNLIRQDMEDGAGVAVLDPHGDLVDRLLRVVPKKRIEDVILFDPADEEYSIGFNILGAHSDLEKNLLASDLISVFQRLSTSWGDQMGSVLNNAILAFLESSRGGTLVDLRRFLIEPSFREEFLSTVRDPDIVYYWKKGFALLSGNKSLGPVLTRLDTFLSPKPIRYMVAQPRNRLHFAEIMDTGKIFLAKLSQGLFGKENSFLLGTLIVSKFQQLAMARQRQQEARRKDYTLFIDEFHNFITPSMAEILSGARKYRLGLVLAHQELRQLQRDSDVASAVMSNAGTRICFRVSDDDARKLADGFSFFSAPDLQNLSTGEAICRVERSDQDFNLKVPFSNEPHATEADQNVDQIITASREKYATARGEIEAALLRERHLPKEQGPAASPRAKPTRASPSPAPEPEASAPDLTVPLPTREAWLFPAPSLSPPLTEPRASEPKPEAPPPDMGRGGAQHQAIQQRLKAVAEGLGYRATVEKTVLDGRGSVDLALEKQERSIACEISVTTTIDHEVGNVTKCLKAGFEHIAVISGKTERLRQISEAIKMALPGEQSARIEYYLPDEFIAHLQSLTLEDVQKLPANAPEERKRGYRVKRSFVQLTPEEAKAREEAAFKMLAETMRRKS